MEAAIDEPVKWSPFVEAQHHMSVIIPGHMQAMEPEQWPEFLEWLAKLVDDARKDPEAMAYSVG